MLICMDINNDNKIIRGVTFEHKAFDLERYCLNDQKIMMAIKTHYA